MSHQILLLGSVDFEVEVASTGSNLSGTIVWIPTEPREQPGGSNCIKDNNDQINKRIQNICETTKIAK